MKKSSLLFAFAVSAVLALSACNKKKGDQFAGTDGDFVTSTPLGERFEGDANFFSNTVAKGQFSPVYFGYDSYAVSPAESSKVQQVAAALKDASSSRLIIAGFTDERGTEEYNRGLGERRALAVREALIGKGISGGRVQTVSFGEEMPVASGGGEAAWAANRRAEFGIIR